MNFQVISLFPEMILAGLKEGVVAQSIEKKMITLECLSPRKFTQDVHQSIDDRPFGGGDGMILMPEPLNQAIEYFTGRQSESEKQESELIYLSARGEVFNDQMARELARKKTLTLICGRYGGVDQRVLMHNKAREVSIGDYILSGGELGALVLIDAIARHLPGVLGNQLSAEFDSFSNGMLEAPSFTRTREWKDLHIPPILFSGDHKKIKQWREYLSLFSTIQAREDLFSEGDFMVKFLQEAQIFFKEMSESEKHVCGLTDTPRILKKLVEAISEAISQKAAN